MLYINYVSFWSWKLHEIAIQNTFENACRIFVAIVRKNSSAGVLHKQDSFDESIYPMFSPSVKETIFTGGERAHARN